MIHAGYHPERHGIVAVLRYRIGLQIHGAKNSEVKRIGDRPTRYRNQPGTSNLFAYPQDQTVPAPARIQDTTRANLKAPTVNADIITIDTGTRNRRDVVQPTIQSQRDRREIVLFSNVFQHD